MVMVLWNPFLLLSKDRAMEPHCTFFPSISSSAEEHKDYSVQLSSMVNRRS